MHEHGAGSATQRLRTETVHAEDLCEVPTIHVSSSQMPGTPLPQGASTAPELKYI